MVTRDTGALTKTGGAESGSEFVRIGKPWLCTAAKVTQLGTEAPRPGIYGADTHAPRTQR